MKLNYLIATFFYSGYFPKAPGTFGSFVALLFLFIINYFFGFMGVLIFFLFTTISGFFTAGKVADAEKIEDPGFIVIDEAAGLSLAVLISYGKPYFLILSFVLFRFFDILKPLFIKKFEHMGNSGTGIMLDDLVAGIYAGIVISIMFKIIWKQYII